MPIAKPTQQPVTRFAPSPNGSLHPGHAYAAIRAHDLAVGPGAGRSGRFLLRIEDIDGIRSKPELAQEHRDDLAWLGLEWEEVAPQSQRLDTYRAAAETLRAMGLLYRCDCTRSQIMAQNPKIGSEGPVYPGTCRERTDVPEESAAWRLDVARAVEIAGPLIWYDELAGEQSARPDLLGDVVLMRKEAPASYHLAATLDDAADGVTLVTRGRDLFAATHIHRLLQALLELPVPHWRHHALLLDRTGEKLAKRRGSASLADRRRAGEDGIALAGSLREGNLPAGILLGRY